MGISEHLTFEEMSKGSHMMTAYGKEIEAIAVSELTCGHLTIIYPPENPDDDVRDQHTLFLKAKSLSGEEVELLFNVGQIHQLGEAVLGIIREHILQAFKLLEPPRHMQDDFDEQFTNIQSLYSTIASISSMSEMVMRAQEMKEGKRLDSSEAFGDVGIDPETARRLLELIDQVMDDELDALEDESEDDDDE